MCDYRLIWSFLRWYWNVKTFFSWNGNKLFHTSPEGKVGSSVGCAALWNSISFSNIFLFFRGILKLMTYIILLLDETNQRPLYVLRRGRCKTYWLIWNQISTMSLSAYCIVSVHLLQGVTWLFLIRKRKWNYTTTPFTFNVCVIGIGAKSQLI